MSDLGWADAAVKKLTVFDIGLVKLGMVAFGLMIAKLWEPILSLEWYWYGVIGLLAVARPTCTILK